MKKLLFFFTLISIFNYSILEINKIKIFNNNKVDNSDFNGIYKIKNINNYNLFIKKNLLILSNKSFSFFIFIKQGINSYYIKSRKTKKLLSFDDKNIIQLYENKNKINNKMIWILIQIDKNKYLIQNKFNKKFIGISNNLFLTLNELINESNNFIFLLLKIFEEGNTKIKFLKIVNSEPIDIVIKYIDLTDKQLNRSGIKQIYKDRDNEELRYSVRSILLNIPWIRKIFIIMPNENVRFFKSIDKIRGKIIYIKDKDLLGFDSANNVACSFNLHKLEKFGISKNFIYMDDDYFFGMPLKKKDFFYYDEKDNKVYPYIISSKFIEINKTYVLEKYNKMYENRDAIHPHSGKGFSLSLLSTEKFYIENYNNLTLIKTEHTHNAIPENIDDLKEIFDFIQKYKYINETLKSKERHILRLSQQHCYSLYQLNIKHKKVHSIPYKYFQMETLSKFNLMNFKVPLFVLNTGGNHIPLKRQYKIEKKIMDKLFSYPQKYENYKKKKKLKPLYFIFYSNLIFIFIKLL